jgi:DNA-directed RNA polymerase sigma subunit (sigma70/sigma32)
MGSIDGGYFEDDRDKHSNGDFRPSEHSWGPVNPTASEQRAIEEDFLLTDLARIVQATFEDHNDSVMPAFGLSELEKDVIKLRILTNQPLNLAELGEALGISPTRARNAEARALTKLRVSFHSVDKLKDYLRN